jgi:MFS family permease
VADSDTSTSTGTDARRVALLLGLLFGLAGTGSSAVAVALPALAADLGISIALSAWVISGYALTLAITTAVYGRVADLAGIRMPLAFGVGLMAAGALLAAAAPSVEVLVAGRLLQGAGAAAVPVLGMAIISARYDGATRAGALGRVAGVAAAVGCLGPLAGGVLETWLGWRSVVALPVLGLLLGPALWSVTPAAGTGGRLDVKGAVLVGAAASGLVLLVQSPSTGVVAAAVGALLVALAAPGAAARVRVRPEGFLPRAVVTEPLVVRSALAAAAIPAAWFALLVAVPAVLAARGWEPLEIGLALVPSAVTGFLAPRMSGPLLVRLGSARALAVSGGVALVALLVAALGGALGSAVLLVAGVVLVTVAFGLGHPALMAAVGGAVPADVRGVALGIAMLVFLVGGGVGSAVVGGLGQLIGLPQSLAALAVLPLLGVAAVLTGSGRPVRTRR